MPSPLASHVDQLVAVDEVVGDHREGQTAVVADVVPASWASSRWLIIGLFRSASTGMLSSSRGLLTRQFVDGAPSSLCGGPAPPLGKANACSMPVHAGLGSVNPWLAFAAGGYGLRARTKALTTRPPLASKRA